VHCVEAAHEHFACETRFHGVVEHTLQS